MAAAIDAVVDARGSDAASSARTSIDGRFETSDRGNDASEASVAASIAIEEAVAVRVSRRTSPLMC